MNKKSWTFNSWWKSILNRNYKIRNNPFSKLMSTKTIQSIWISYTTHLRIIIIRRLTGSTLSIKAMWTLSHIKIGAVCTRSGSLSILESLTSFRNQVMNISEICMLVWTLSITTSRRMVVSLITQIFWKSSWREKIPN